MYEANWQTQQLQLMNARAQLAFNINRTMYNVVYNVRLERLQIKDSPIFCYKLSLAFRKLWASNCPLQKWRGDGEPRIQIAAENCWTDVEFSTNSERRSFTQGIVFNLCVLYWRKRLKILKGSAWRVEKWAKYLYCPVCIINGVHWKIPGTVKIQNRSLFFIGSIATAQMVKTEDFRFWLINARRKASW